MNQQNLPTDIFGKTVTTDDLVKVRSPKVPLILKMAITAFLAVFLPVYLHVYGPTNFLWFCDAALIFTAMGMWLENSLLI